MIAAKLGVVLLLVSGLEAGPGPKAAPGPAPEPAPWGWRFINSNGVQGASGNPYAVADPYAFADPYAPVAPIAPVAPVLPIDGVAGANLPWNFFINAEQPQLGVKSMSGDPNAVQGPQGEQISINLGGPGRWWWKKK